MQFGVNKHLYLFQRPQIALAVQAWGILVSLKNLLTPKCNRNHVTTQLN